MTDYDLGKVVGDDGTDGDDGSTIWNTSTAPTYANSKYTFTISNLTGKTGFSVAVDDLIFYDTYYYIVATVNSTTVDCTTRVSIKGSTGSTGATGNGISSISKTGTSGLVDTYTISYTNGGSDTFTVTNGSDATVTIVTSFSSTTSDSKVPSEKLVKTELDKKIATSNTSGLVKNDGTIDTNTYLTSASLSGYQTTSNLVTSFSSTTSDSKYPSEKLTKTELDKKIEKSSTSGLVKNDGSIDTNSYITSASVPSASSSTPSADTSSGAVGTGTTWARADHIHPKSSIYAESSHTHTKSQITDFPSLSTVATSGSYTDLSNKPSIPSSSSDLSDGSSLVKTSSTTGLIKNDGSIDTNKYFDYGTEIVATAQNQVDLDDITDVGQYWMSLSSSIYISNKPLATGIFLVFVVPNSDDYISQICMIIPKGIIYARHKSTSGFSAWKELENASNKVTSWSSTVNDTHYPSEKLVSDSLATKQDTLISGSNIKTINNTSILGSGNISISGGSDGDYFFTMDSFFDPNQWTGSPTISNGTITMTSDATFPSLRLPPNCTLTFDITVTENYEEDVNFVGFYTTLFGYDTTVIYDINITNANNTGTFTSEESGDEITNTNMSSRTGLSIPVTSGTTATITNVKYRDANTDEIYDLIGDAILYINGSGN